MSDEGIALLMTVGVIALMVVWVPLLETAAKMFQTRPHFEEVKSESIEQPLEATAGLGQT